MERQWFVATPAGVQGPMDGAAVVALVRSGGTRPDTQVCTTDDHRWIEMRSVPELAREMAQQDAVAPHDQPPVPLPPPPPGEPWFYNVPIGRAVVLQWVSFGIYYYVWQDRHQSWLRRRAPPEWSAADPVYEVLAGELASATAALGLPPDPRLLLPRPIELPPALVFLCLCLWPFEVVMDLWFLRKAQVAAEIVNRKVAPGAARPPMQLGEWIALAAGLAVWFLMVGFVLK